MKDKKYIKDNFFDNRGRFSPNKIKYGNHEEFLNYLKSKYNNDYNIFEIIYLYLNNLEKRPLCKQCNRELIFKSFKKGYDLYCSRSCSYRSKERIENSKNTFKKRYNKEHILQVEQFKEQVKKTKQKKYGNPNYNNRDKYYNTIKNRYNINNIMYKQKFKDKKKQTIIKKYGVNSYKQKDIKNYSAWIDDKKFIEIYNRLESVEDICNYFNVSPFPIHQRINKLQLLYKPRKKDVIIKKIGKTIESLGYNVEYNNRTIIKPLELDIIIRKNGNIIKTLEYNGLMFHSIGISEHKVFNNWDKYRDNLLEYINKDIIKLDMCKKLNIELLILREDIYLNNPNIIDMWLNGELKYNVLEEPVIYKFKNVNKLETIQYRVYNSNYTNSHCRRPNKIWSSHVLREIEDSIENGYRIYFDWIEI